MVGMMSIWEVLFHIYKDLLKVTVSLQQAWIWALLLPSALSECPLLARPQGTPPELVDSLPVCKFNSPGLSILSTSNQKLVAGDSLRLLAASCSLKLFTRLPCLKLVSHCHNSICKEFTHPH
jgi:hypothetical protein